MEDSRHCCISLLAEASVKVHGCIMIVLAGRLNVPPLRLELERWVTCASIELRFLALLCAGVSRGIVWNSSWKLENRLQGQSEFVIALILLQRRLTSSKHMQRSSTRLGLYADRRDVQVLGWDFGRIFYERTASESLIEPRDVVLVILCMM